MISSQNQPEGHVEDIDAYKSVLVLQQNRRARANVLL